jgi:hypothetical protein
LAHCRRCRVRSAVNPMMCRSTVLREFPRYSASFALLTCYSKRHSCRLAHGSLSQPSYQGVAPGKWCDLHRALLIWAFPDHHSLIPTRQRCSYDDRYWEKALPAVTWIRLITLGTIRTVSIASDRETMWQLTLFDLVQHFLAFAPQIDFSNITASLNGVMRCGAKHPNDMISRLI